ncbi:MAG: type VI secretion system contractile sheath large subunit, partial [Phycisphaerales bacterium JB037]
MESWLNNWIAKYVTTDPTASEEVKARLPLAAAEVTVADIEGNPGYYAAKFALRPHYQLEGLTATLNLVSKLPSQKG